MIFLEREQRPAFADFPEIGMNTWLAILFLIIASTATATVRDINPMPLTATEKANDGDSRKARCIKPRMFVLALKVPGGRVIPVKTIIVFKPC